MKRFLICAAVFCFVLSASLAAFSGGPVAFREEKATVTRDGVDTYGQVFTMVDDPAKFLVLAGDKAFMVDTAANSVRDAAINSVDDKTYPTMIDYGILSEVSGAGLTRTGDGRFTFRAKGNKYEVK